MESPHSPAAPPGPAPDTALWIELDPAGMRAEVRPARAGEAPPAHTHVLRPGQELRRIGFETWRRHVGRAVDLRLAGPFSRESTPRLVELTREFYRALDEAVRESERRAPGQPEYRFDGAAGNDWRGDPEVYGDPPADAEYGCCAAGVFVPCSRDELAQWCATLPYIVRVWTPETGGLARPEEVPFLVEAYRAHALRAALRGMLWSSLVLATTVAMFSTITDWERTGLVLVPAFSAVRLLTGAFAAREAWSAGPQVFAEHRAIQRHSLWLAGHRPRTALWIVGCLAAVMVVRMAGGDAAMEAAGLVKPAVWQGQAWRLLTGPLLHVNLLHILMNALGLLALGIQVEAHIRRGALPLVFLASVLGGSLLSLVALPAPSVGASGGLMGLIGFMGVFGLRHRERLPPRYLQEIALSIAATALLGIVATRLIDNAAHLGGLLTGVLVGLFLAEPRRDPEPWTRHAGRVALAVIFAGGALAIVLMLAAG
ncbi:MAG TPA: rhomboid family intramembrane serine protease [Longimicrobiaceae bacterium]|jgi:membrane associated rhomboid family serine protease